MLYNKLKYLSYLLFGMLALGLFSCKNDPDPPVDPNPVVIPKDTTTLDNGPIDFSKLKDTYADVASPFKTKQWAHYNVHDPAYVVDDDFTYCYNTDVAYGHEIRPGIQIRRSINLVEWEFVGWAFPGLPTMGSNFIRQNGGEPFDGLWAPYVIKVGDEYRLYYSLSSSTPRLSVIGLATSKDPKGPFREQGLAVTSKNDSRRQTNAIDPTVIIDKAGKHWMYYGSAWDGIYKLELDPETGLAVRNEDKGTRVAQRAFTGNTVNGNIEGPEIIYNEEFDKYYMFIAYDWLESKYNVRVGRSESATGPFYDMFGNDMNKEIDDRPMILAPYRFKGHSGWQGVSHPGVFKKDDRFYIGHQGRPGQDRFFMVMHVRQLFWTEDGWPLVSSQRYAGEEEGQVEESELSGSWEIIDFDYNVVPGYAEEQIFPDFQDSEFITLDQGGTINNDAGSTWTYNQPWLTLNIGGRLIEGIRLEKGRDWENEVGSTPLMTGINPEGRAFWGKKVE